jgi:N-acetyl-anhydromuramyl-L-alanine amidase AmpD
MKWILTLCCLGLWWIQAQVPVQSWCKTLEKEFPEIPEGLAEAVSMQASRGQWIAPKEEQLPCHEKPLATGFTGLIKHGAGILRENLAVLEDLSGIDAEDIRHDGRMEMRAWFLAMRSLGETYQPQTAEEWLWLASLLSEIPSEGGEVLPLALWLDETAHWWKQTAGVCAQVQQLVPAEHWEVLRDHCSPNRIDQPGVLVQIAPTCNRGSRNGTAVSAVTVHTAQGTYAGTIAWFMNCQSNVSAHYVIRSSDGQITQMVAENDRAFHVGTENGYTVGIEHEGYVSNPTWLTDTLIKKSAHLVRGICQRHQMSTHRVSWWAWAATTHYNQAGIPGSCARIKGHQHYPNQTHTDPGAHFPWDTYYKRINPQPMIQSLAGLNGQLNFPNSGTSYFSDTRQLWRIGQGTSPLQLQFLSFDTEANWDEVWVYDGTHEFAPLLGRYSGSTLPSAIIATSGYATIEFRSDCAIEGTGFQLQWHQSPAAGDTTPPQSTLIQPLTGWQTSSFMAHIQDIDPIFSEGPVQCFIRADGWDGQEFRSNGHQGMLYDDFTVGPMLHADWVPLQGTWTVTGQHLIQPDLQMQSAQAAVFFKPNLNQSLVLRTHFKMLGMGHLGIYLLGDSLNDVDHRNSLLLEVLQSGQIQLTRCSPSGRQLLMSANYTPSTAWMRLDVMIDPVFQQVKVWVNGQLVMAKDQAPIPYGGRWISFKTHYSQLEVSQIKIFRERPCNQPVLIPVGSGLLAWLHNPNAHPQQPGGQLSVLSLSHHDRWSQEQTYPIHLDFTPPLQASMVSDDALVDRDTLTGAQWTAYWHGIVDVHSGVAQLELALGTAPGLTDIQDFVPIGQTSPQSIPLTGSPGAGQWIFPTLRATNHAGLTSESNASDGMLYLPLAAATEEKKEFVVFPNPSTDVVHLQGYEGLEVPYLISMDGKKIQAESHFYLPNGIMLKWPAGLSTGQYILHIPNELSIPLVITKP